MYYFGPLVNPKNEDEKFTVMVFTSRVKPTYHTHGHLISHCYGGYRTREEAVENARRQFAYIRRFVNKLGKPLKWLQEER